MTDSAKKVDPYTSKASDNATVQEKIKEVNSIISSVQTCMLTTISSIDGSSSPALHSRAMNPITSKSSPIDSDEVTLSQFKFIGNVASGKFDEISHNPQVNISFFDPATSDWASVSGEAKLSGHKGSGGNDVGGEGGEGQGNEEIQDLWNPVLKSWFGDLGDGIHTGDWNDPRVCLIKVTPSEIRYWKKTSSLIGEAYQVAKGAVTGEVASPGHLRTIISTELALAQQTSKKNW